MANGNQKTRWKMEARNWKLEALRNDYGALGEMMNRKSVLK